jgi:cycloeucalenol cycloisomerase
VRRGLPRLASTPASERGGGWASWLSPNPVKRHVEAVLAKWCVGWVAIVALVVATRAFEHFGDVGYLLVGIVVCVPTFALPALFPGPEADVPMLQRYATKHNLWIWLFAFHSNYVWTHYFYVVLGTKYTFATWRLNDVPITCYLLTHSYFTLYHLCSNAVLRRVWNAFGGRVSWHSVGAVTLAIGALSYLLAFLETFTIQNFPYYELADRRAMYLYGSVFYGLYFVVSFPMFLRIEETPKDRWSLGRVAIDGFAAGMLVTYLLDFWRLALGPIHALKVTPQVPFVH